MAEIVDVKKNEKETEIKELLEELENDEMSEEEYARKEAEREEKEKSQRAERGYSDSDVWNMGDWFIRTARPMLKQLAENNMGFPSDLEVQWVEDHKDEVKMNYDEFVCWPSEDKDPKGYELRSRASEECDAKWKGILKRMAFLLGEMGEETCTKKNPYEDEWWSYHEKFDKKYGSDRDVLKTEEELQREKKTHTFLHVGPERDPEFGKEYKEVSKKMYDAESDIWKYREKCKNEFFELFSKYFWNLWD